MDLRSFPTRMGCFLAFCTTMWACSSDPGDDPNASSETSGGASSPCEEAFFVRCERACECQPGPECTFAPGQTTSPDGDITIHTGALVKTEEDCRSLVVIECNEGGGPAPDFPKCIELTKAAACEEFEAEGTTYTGVPPFAECDFH